MSPPLATPHQQRRNYAARSAKRFLSALPEDARAIIEREPRPVTQSAPALRRDWGLRFHRRRPGRVDPLTGWTSGADPLAHLSLRFPNLGSAIRYAEDHDLPYDVRDWNPGWDGPIQPRRREKHSVEWRTSCSTSSK